MFTVNRRDFVKLGGLAGLGGVLDPEALFQEKPRTETLRQVQDTVKFTRDGIDLSPLEYSRLLFELAEAGKISADNYSRGGVVEELEVLFARLLGKESAVFMPTGTLANHIALRKLAGEEKKVIVQAESHIYNDSGDCAQILSGLNLIPLAPQRATFDIEEVRSAVKKANSGRVLSPVGVISIETPVRRMREEMFDFNEMTKIAAFARHQGIRMHLDGARLFIAAVHSGLPPSDYAANFDTVYTSLYKAFNAASGAILAGSKEFTKDLYHLRRMFGGGMPQVWPFAAVALHYVPTFLEDYARALKNAEKFFGLIEQNESFRIEKLPNGTNVFKLHVKGVELEGFRQKLRKQNIHIPGPTREGSFFMKTNVTLGPIEPDVLAEKFIEALKLK
jgi:threonine aldolase